MSGPVANPGPCEECRPDPVCCTEVLASLPTTLYATFVGCPCQDPYVITYEFDGISYNPVPSPNNCVIAGPLAPCSGSSLIWTIQLNPSTGTAIASSCAPVQIEFDMLLGEEDEMICGTNRIKIRITE